MMQEQQEARKAKIHRQRNKEDNTVEQIHVAQQKYQYLHPSVKKDCGFFKGQQFDLRFDEIRNTMVEKNVFAAGFTFLFNSPDYVGQYPKQPKTKQDWRVLEEKLPMVKPNFEIIPKTQIRYTWIGHSTAVIQVGADNLLIDPVFSDRCSKVQFAGPKRFRPPACEINELPKIDMVLISHDHYDHLDETSLGQLQERFKPFFLAGIGTEDVLPEGSRGVLFDWMETKTIIMNSREYIITFVPVCHWSRRGLNDYNTRLWGGFVIETPFKQKIFYSGDTGYCGVFKEIGDKFGPFDLTILPIGAYEPRELLRPQHVNPQQSVLVHKQLKSKQSIGVHWGTFPLGKQGFYQPKEDLQKAKIKLGLAQKQFVTVKHGESIIFG